MRVKKAIDTSIENMSDITMPSGGAGVPPAGYSLPRALAESLRFEYSQGGLVRVSHPFHENYRVYPFDHITLVKSGKLECFTDTGLDAVGADKVSFIPAGAIHRAATVQANGAELAWMRFRFTVLGTVSLLAFFEIPRRIPLRHTRPSIRAIVPELIRLGGKMPPAEGDWRMAARRQVLGFSLLMALLSVAREKPSMRHFLLHTGRLEPVLNHIHADFTRPLTIAGLARIACLSVSRFTQVFKSVTGASPLQYVKQVRLNRALELLAATDLPIAELCAKTGYPDQFHFCRLFKARFGVSPSAYRKSRENVVF